MGSENLGYVKVMVKQEDPRLPTLSLHRKISGKTAKVSGVDHVSFYELQSVLKATFDSMVPGKHNLRVSRGHRPVCVGGESAKPVRQSPRYRHI